MLTGKDLSLLKMESRILPLTSNPLEPEFNGIQFEKRLMQLKDSQESINAMSSWCMENRMHHKKIVIAWLSVLKKVKVEQRLTLFYLANDVIQYSKRKNYDFVESWGTTLQKATTLVREEKVKNRILRIFKIWEQRGIYGEEFIADLSGLISASPSAQKLNQDPQDFQPSYLITRIRSCAKLETDTDLKLKLLKDSNPKITDSETLCASLKDRRHVEDVEKEVESGITLFEGYVNALKAEIKSRTHVISCLTQGDTFYNEERKEVKVVVNAYKNFTTRVKNLQKKLEDLKPSLSSPIPSPDINAPSPVSDSDIELPNNDENNKIKCQIAAGVSVFSVTDSYNANYYTPTTTAQSQDNFANNGFSSFMGSNIPFDLQNFNTSNIFSDQTHAENYNIASHNAQHDMQDSQTIVNYDQTPEPQNSINYNSNVQTHPASSYNPSIQSQIQPAGNYNPTPQQPLLPPPMPPFTSSYMETAPYTDTTYAPAVDSYVNNANYEPVGSAQYAVSSEIQTTYAPQADAYNPEEEIETWEPETTWDAPSDLETPESPPIFEKEGFADPIEYDDSKNTHTGLIKDVDHRVLLPPPQMPLDLAGEDTDLRIIRISGAKDVDHRNLISLTGSPTNDPPGLLQPPPAPPAMWTGLADQDYRTQHDQDYRDFASQLKLPPPPPPPPKTPSPYKSRQQSINQDNVESIDMDLSDDENAINSENVNPNGARNNIVTLVENVEDVLEPPPPIPHNMTEIAIGDMMNPDELSNLINENGPPLIQMDGDIMRPPLQHMDRDMMRPPPQHRDGDIMGPPPMQHMDGGDMMGPPLQQMPDMGMNPNWAEEWRCPDFGDRQFRGNFPGKHKNEFRGGYRGRGRGGGGNFASSDHGDRFRGQGHRGRGGGGMRTRPYRGGGNGRGNFNNRGLRGGFRGKFRGGF